MPTRSVIDRLIVALDVADRSAALRLVQQLEGKAGYFKIGSRLFTREGPQLVREIIASGQRVFLDLKYHDIPDIVASAVVEAFELRVSMMTVHIAGGEEMMMHSRNRLEDAAREHSRLLPLLLGVTVLTSLDSAALRAAGVVRPVKQQVLFLARQAEHCGLAGVVASAQESELLRREGLTRLKIVTPGIRPSGSVAGDQRRVLTPARAIAAGCDYLVVGRPITQDPHPAEAADRILDEMAGAL